MGCLDYELTVDDQIAYNLHLRATSPQFRRATGRLRWGSAAAGLAVGLLGLGLGTGQWLLGGVLGLAAAALIWWMYPRSSARSMAAGVRRLAASRDPSLVGAVSLRWDDAGIHQQGLTSSSTVTWGQVDRVETTTDHVFVFTGPLTAVIVPKRAGAGVTSFVEEIRARAGTDRAG